LLRAPGIGPARYKKLLARFETPEAVLAAPRHKLEPLRLPPAAIAFLQRPDANAIKPD
jgi:DNA processing protein